MDNCLHFPMNFEKKLRYVIIKNNQDASPNISISSLIKEHNLKRNDKIIVAVLYDDEDEDIISFHIIRINNDDIYSAKIEEIELLASQHTLRVCLEETIY